MNVEKQQFGRRKKNASKPKTSDVKTRNSEHRTAENIDMRSDISNVSSLCVVTLLTR